VGRSAQRARSVARASGAIGIREQIVVFQESTLDDYLTAEQNLLFHAYAYNVPADVRQVRMEELLKLVELWTGERVRSRLFPVE